jgi:hypothetical protein
MQKRKAGQPHKGWKSAARKARLPAGGWNTDLEAMPVDGHFEVLRVYPDVFRHSHASHHVIEPMKGRMFVPTAWRPARRKPSA